MVDEWFARWRRLNIELNFTNDDFFDFLQQLEALHPETIYFDTRAMRRISDVWGNGHPIMTLAELAAGNDPPVTYNSWRDCIAAMPVRIENNDGARFKCFSARAPWPEEVATKRAGVLTGSRARPLYFGADRDFAAWRAFGRLVALEWYMDYPKFMSGAEVSGLRDYKGVFDIGLERCSAPAANGYHTLFDMHFCRNDADMSAFANTIKRLSNRLTTRDYGVYDCETGRHLGDEIAHRYWKTSKRLMKMLAMKTHSYSFLFHLHGIIKGSNNPTLLKLMSEPNRWVGLGPTLRMRAETFLEAGLSIDDIEGLDQATRDAELRRYEKRLKAAAKTAGQPKGRLLSTTPPQSRRIFRLSPRPVNPPGKTGRSRLSVWGRFGRAGPGFDERKPPETRRFMHFGWLGPPGGDGS